MKLTTDKIRLANSPNSGNWVLQLVVPTTEVDELNKLMNKECLKTVEVKQHREKRSLDANSYAFKLMSKIAEVLTSTTEEVYEQMLRRYGVHDYCVVITAAIPTLKKAFKYIDVNNKVKVNGKDAVQVKCILGSSNYDSLQMSKFIDGIKTECDTLKITTMTPKEIEQLIKNMEV